MTYRPIIVASQVSRDYGYSASGLVTEKYDDVANTWTAKANLNTARTILTGFSLNGYGYTVGGYTTGYSAATEKYDDVANIWTTKANLNTARQALAGFSLNGYGYTAGGDTSGNSLVTERYDDVANAWTPKANLNTARMYLAGFSLNGYGYTAAGIESGLSPITEKYDDVANIWTPKANMNTARFGPGEFSLNSYGYTAGGNVATTEKYDDVANTWITKTSLSISKYGLAGFSLNGYGYTAGGTTTVSTATTEKYDDVANTWTTKANMNTPKTFLAGFSLGGLQAGVQNPEIIPIYKTINKSKIAAIWLGAESAYLPATNPAVFNEVAGSTTYAGFTYLTFDDTTAQTAVWRVPVSKYDGGNIVTKAFSKPQITPAGAVTLQYDILTIGLANDVEYNSAVLVDTGVNIIHSLGTTTLSTELSIASATIDPANVMADDLLVIGIRRDVVSDNLVGNGQLLGILLEYTKA